MATNRKTLWALVAAAIVVVGMGSVCVLSAVWRAAQDTAQAAVGPTATPTAPGTRKRDDAAGIRGTRPSPPADPEPPFANEADQVPKLEAKLSGMKAYETVWAPEHRADLTVLLTGVSQLLSFSGFGEIVSTDLRKTGLKKAAIVLYQIQVRTGRFPKDFTEKLKEYLPTIADEPHLGLWRPEGRGQAPYDLAAVAAWVHREDPRYLREHIAARREGPSAWMDYAANRAIKPAWVEWLALPGAAYSRLAAMTKLTDAEWSDWCRQLGQQRAEKIDTDTGTEHQGCGCSDGRAVSWEELRDGWPLTVPGGCLHCDAHLVTFTYRGVTYGVNGSARDHGYRAIDRIWADDPKGVTPKIPVGSLISMGQGLCE